MNGEAPTRKVLAVLFALVLVTVLGLVRPAVARPAAEATAVQAPNALTGYYNLLGYEGIPTLGASAFTNGTPPPVADYVTTHCRYIDVQNTTVGHYYLRYPLDLPNGATITGVTLYVADFNPTGVLWAYLRSRPWNSRDAGDTEGLTLTDNSSENDKQISMGTLDVYVDNHTTEYWIDVSPQNGTDPGQLCVYGVQVQYSYNGAFLPLIRNGG